MDKSNFKKLALMGMAGGMILTSHTPATVDSNVAETHVAAGQSGCAGCGGGRRANQQAPKNYGGYTADSTDSMYDVQTSGKTMSESELSSRLNTEGKALFNGLDPEFKSMALRNAASGRYTDPNEAVKEAAKRQADRRHGIKGS